MTIFKAGDMVVPKNKEEERIIRAQINFYDERPPPWRVLRQEGSGKHHFLYMSNGVRTIALFHWRFMPVFLDKPLEDYM